MHFPHTVSLLTATVTGVLREDNCTPHEGFPVRHEKWLRCSKQRSHHVQPSPGVLNSPSAFSVVTSLHLWEPLCLSELPLMPWDGLLTKGPAIVRVTFTRRPHGAPGRGHCLGGACTSSSFSSAVSAQPPARAPTTQGSRPHSPCPSSSCTPRSAC